MAGWIELGKGETDDAGIFGSVVDGHVAAPAVVVAVGKELAHEVLKGEASLLEDACFSVLCEYHVVWG